MQESAYLHPCWTKPRDQTQGFSAENPLPVLIHFRSRSNPPIGGGLAGSRSDRDKSAYAKMRTSADRIDLDPIAIEALVRTGLKTVLAWAALYHPVGPQAPPIIFCIRQGHTGYGFSTDSEMVTTTQSTQPFHAPTDPVKCTLTRTSSVVCHCVQH